VSPAEVIDYRERCRTLVSVAAWGTGQVNLTGDGDPVRVGAARVTANTFETLGAAGSGSVWIKRQPRVFCFFSRGAPLPLSFAFLFPATIDEYTGEGYKGCDNCRKSRGVLVNGDQSDPANDSDEAQDEGEGLPAFLRSDVAVDDCVFKALAMPQLAFRHRDDSVCSVWNNSVVAFQHLRRRERTLKRRD